MGYVAENIEDSVDDWTRLKAQLQRMENQIAELTRLIDPVPAHSHAASDITSGAFGTPRIEDKAVTQGKLSQDLQTQLGMPLFQVKTVGFSGNIAKLGTLVCTYTPPTVDGYTAVGVVGVTTNHTWLCICYFNKGAVWIYNPGSGATTVEGQSQILYIKTSALS